jgi:hypothetical protein
MSEVAPSRPGAWNPIVRSAAIVVVLFAAYGLLPFRGERWWVGALLGTVLLVAMVPTAVRRLRRVLASDRPLVEAIEALVLMLAMLITGFGAVYFAMNRDGRQISGLDTRLDAIYFTVTTLATVGFGDIAAASQSARLLVTVQMMFDLVFVGVAVRVFANMARRRSDEQAGGTGTGLPPIDM